MSFAEQLEAHEDDQLDGKVRKYRAFIRQVVDGKTLTSKEAVSLDELLADLDHRLGCFKRDHVAKDAEALKTIDSYDSQVAGADQAKLEQAELDLAAELRRLEDQIPLARAALGAARHERRRVSEMTILLDRLKNSPRLFWDVARLKDRREVALAYGEGR